MTEFSLPQGLWLGRVWRAGIGPSLVTIRAGHVFDITSKAAPTMRDLLELPDIAGFVASLSGEDLGPLAAFAAASIEPSEETTRLLAPCDLQAIKACGVTFARSMVERVIEERAAGNPALAAEIRARVAGVIGDSLRDLIPGSAKAAEVKALLQAEGLWSQYLEVGIGPDAEIFTKGQPLSSVGAGVDIGVHPASTWNNPEPEVVLVVSSRGAIVGAALGNDVNLRDVEGRSALLLGKAKDNNAAAAVGPFVRLFDGGFDLDAVRALEISLTVTGRDGFVMNGRSAMDQISRDPADLAAQAINAHHRYPDGLVLFLGTLFAPVEDRYEQGKGFTHATDDVVRIACDRLGALVNRVRPTDQCEPWTFGAADLMRNLARRGLI